MSYMPKSHKRGLTAILSLVIAFIAWALMLIPDDVPPLGHAAVVIMAFFVAFVLIWAALPIEMKND